MKAINAYISFDGTARKAMTFYAKTLGAEYKEPTFPNAPDFGDRVIHATVSKGDMLILASDSAPGMHPPARGTNVGVCVQCDDVPEIERVFKSFSDGGTVTMPLANTFWGARFGMLTDKFGICWMFNCDLPRKG